MLARVDRILNSTVTLLSAVSNSRQRLTLAADIRRPRVVFSAPHFRH
jgi:hypothetical protein